MRLLIVTQAVDLDDPVLGFFHRWIEEFSKHYSRVEVICLRVGRHSLPSNVSIHSLGKESGGSRLVYIARFYRYIWSLRNGYDAVFVHMNPEYVILGGIFWRLSKKRIGLWYVHSKVGLFLRVASVICNDIFSTSSESFRIVSPKVHYTGHGIDIVNFVSPSNNKSSGILRLITVGRVSATKQIDRMLDVLIELDRRNVSFTFTVVGSAATKADMVYQRHLLHRIQTLSFKDRIIFAGPVPHSAVPLYLENANIFLNLSLTGSTDKAVLEAFAAGLQVVTSNKAFREIAFYADDADIQRISDLIESAHKTPRDLRDHVRSRHSLNALVDTIVQYLDKHV